MVSNRGTPRGSGLQPCTRTRGLCSCCLVSACCSWSSRSHPPSRASPLTATLTGSVLISSPTISSTPSSSPDLPDTVAPYTTSWSPLQRLSSSPQAPCTTVFGVTRQRLASASSSRLTASASSTSSTPYPSPSPSAPSHSPVGPSIPFSSPLQ